MLTRRRLLMALAASACVPPAGPLAAPPPLPLALGWRLTPGDLFSFLAVTERRHPQAARLRSERWTWRVREVRHGIAQLEARVTALGAGERLGDAVDDSPAAPSPPTELSLGRDGTLHGITDPSLIASLPHYALAMGLPDTPVGLHEEWADPIGRSAATLLAAELEPEGSATTVLRSVKLDDGRAIAGLETRGEVRSVGPLLEIAGTARWDLLSGRLIERTLEIRPSRLGPSGDEPGVLSVHLSA